MDWPPLLDPAALGLPRRRAWRTPLVIGRHGALDRLSWPRSREELLEAYPDEPGLIVHVMAARAQLQALLGSVPHHWKLLDPATTSPRDFLASLDGYAHLPAAEVQPLRIELLEALGSGLPVVLPEALRATFGDAARSTVGAEGVAATLRSAERPAARAALAERAGELIAQRRSAGGSSRARAR